MLFYLVKTTRKRQQLIHDGLSQTIMTFGIRMKTINIGLVKQFGTSIAQ